MSNDDGYGPFQFVQHALTTELKRGSYVVGKTTDIHGPPDNIPVEDIAVRLDGVFTVAELEGLASMIHKLREAGKKVNCQCCKWFIKTGS